MWHGGSTWSWLPPFRFWPPAAMMTAGMAGGCHFRNTGQFAHPHAEWKAYNGSTHISSRAQAMSPAPITVCTIPAAVTSSCVWHSPSMPW